MFAAHTHTPPHLLYQPIFFSFFLSFIPHALLSTLPLLSILLFLFLFLFPFFLSPFLLFLFAILSFYNFLFLPPLPLYPFPSRFQFSPLQLPRTSPSSAHCPGSYAHFPFSQHKPNFSTFTFFVFFPFLVSFFLLPSSFLLPPLTNSYPFVVQQNTHTLNYLSFFSSLTLSWYLSRLLRPASHKPTESQNQNAADR